MLLPWGHVVGHTHGCAGAGKSTFANLLLEAAASSAAAAAATRSPQSAALARPWSRVSQDVLKTRKRCFRATEEALRQGSNVIIDRTNLDTAQVAGQARPRRSQLPHPVFGGGSGVPFSRLAAVLAPGWKLPS
jgi:hypothetical protein